MDNFKDILNDIKERLSSPLFSSFLISWLGFNWRITVALLFYNNNSIKSAGYDSYYALILNNANWWDFFVKPLLAATAYILLYPVIKNWISFFNTRMIRWGTKTNLDIAGTGHVSTVKYLELRSKYKKIIDDLSSVLKEESIYLSEKAELELELQKKEMVIEQDRYNHKNEIEGLKQNADQQSQNWTNSYQIKIDEIENLKADIEVCKQATNVSLLDGRWIKTIQGVAFSLMIDNGKILEVVSKNENKLVERIINFNYEQGTGIGFIVSGIVIPGSKEFKEYNTYHLKFADDFHAMAGSILNKEQVGFVRTAKIIG